MRIFLTLLLLPLLQSFSFSPMSQTINMGEKIKGAQFLIHNESETNIAVELSAKARMMDNKGEETMNDTQDISVFPPQIIIPPGEKRTIRVNYTLKDLPVTEKSYRIIAEQLPLKVDEKIKKKSGINMLMRYVAALYVTPADAEAKIKIVSYVSTKDELQMTIENSGTKHQLLNNPRLKFLHQGQKGELKASDLQGLAGENVLAGHTRTFSVKKTKVIPEGAKVDLQFED